MDSCERQRRAAITFSVINQSLLPNRSEMSLERAQRLLPQNPGADKPHVTSRRQLLPWDYFRLARDTPRDIAAAQCVSQQVLQDSPSERSRSRGGTAP